TVVLLSTNDMHANILNFPKLATAVEACRDTAKIVFLVDAGDRWTGNAYVDMAENRRPMLELMNRLKFDVATLGNHEFDAGHAVLGNMMRYVEFPIVCANMLSDTLAVPQTPPYVILEKQGVKIGFVGVVTNYEGDEYPAGQAVNYKRLTFPDPQRMAAQYATIAAKCDVLVLISHMGTSHDRNFLKNNDSYDLLIGGHSHEVINEMVNGTQLTQTGKNLKNIGATTIRLRRDKITSVDFRVVPLASYAPAADYTAMVEHYYDNPDLKKSVGSLTATAGMVGLANLIADRIADEAEVDVAFYHIGGVRLDSLSAGEVSIASVFGLEPFGTSVCTMEMTPAQMRRMIMAKFNDTLNTKEAHRVDLYATTPYVIVLNAQGMAVDVQFEKLREDEHYSVAVSDYVYKNYKELEYTDGKETGLLITDLLLHTFRDDSPITPDNTPRQRMR
ncbi:MAG: bifunctional UDP-sugar hydrolase/5'-nucleotidase, partial [Alistipes sp.]